MGHTSYAEMIRRFDFIDEATFNAWNWTQIPTNSGVIMIMIAWSKTLLENSGFLHQIVRIERAVPSLSHCCIEIQLKWIHDWDFIIFGLFSKFLLNYYDLNFFLPKAHSTLHIENKRFDKVFQSMDGDVIHLSDVPTWRPWHNVRILVCVNDQVGWILYAWNGHEKGTVRRTYFFFSFHVWT